MLKKQLGCVIVLTILALTVLLNIFAETQQHLQVSPFCAYYLHSNPNFLPTSQPQTSNQKDVPIVHIPSLVSIPCFAWGRNIQSIIDNGFFSWEKNPSLYLYAQQKGTLRSIGIIGKIPIQCFQNNIIKQHEGTIARKVDMYAQNLKMQAASFEPILLGYQGSQEIDTLVTELSQNLPTFSFYTADGTQHAIWRIENNTHIEKISSLFSQIKNCYILDGHHRAAALCKIYEELLANPEQNNFLELYNLDTFKDCHVALFPHHQIHIFAYNRILKNLPQLSDNDFLTMLQKYFTMQPIEQSEATPQKPHEIGMYFAHQWFRLSPKEELLQINTNDPTCTLDISLTNNHIIKPLSKTYNIPVANMVEYVNYTISLSELETQCNEHNAKAAFIFYPITFETLAKIAQNGCVLPEKATWIEPKVNI